MIAGIVIDTRPVGVHAARRTVGLGARFVPRTRGEFGGIVANEESVPVLTLAQFILIRLKLQRTLRPHSARKFVHHGDATPCDTSKELAMRKPEAAQNAAHFEPDCMPSDPDLARVIRTWANMVESIRRAILALVESSLHG
jgi:hypothetical protein